jgi:hypothetical protein
MTRPAIHEYAAAVRGRYQAANRKEKKRLLDEFCEATAMHRKAAIRLLNESAKRQPPTRSGRPKQYGSEALEVLIALWKVGTACAASCSNR